MTWITYALASVLFFVILNLLQRIIATESKNERATAILFNGIAALMALVLFFVTKSYRQFQLPTEYTAWIFFLFASFFYGMFERGRFVASKILDASIMTIIMNISVLVAFIGSIFLYSESLTPNKIAGSLLIFLSLLLVAINGKVGNVSKRGAFIAIIISIMLGLANMLDKMGTIYFSANTYNIFIWTAPFLFVCFPYFEMKPLIKELKTSGWKIALLSSMNVMGYFLMLKSLELTEATRVIPIIQTQTIFTVILGILLLKERDHIFRKIVAGVFAVLGTSLLI